MKQIAKPAAGAAAILTLGAGAALAHTGAGPTAGLAAGLGHPLGGLDHVLAMLAVGFWAAQSGGRAVVALPLAFMAALALAALAGAAGLPFGAAELGIAGSLVALGALVALRAAPPLAVSTLLVAGFGLFHGYAHGAEMPAGAAGLGYGLGFLAATGLLHGAGIGLGRAAIAAGRSRLAPAGGGALAATGLILLLA